MKIQDAHDLLIHMVEIPSPSGGEHALASFLATEMERFGFHSSIDGAGNVVGVRGHGSGPTILMLGHMDTAGDQTPVYRDGSLLFGRGAVDAKGALATLICAAAQVEPGDARLIVVGAVEEETPGSRGAHYLLDRYQPDAVIIGEPSGWSSAVLGYKGRIGLHYAVRRPPSHTASPEEKASEVAIEFWNKLSQYAPETNGHGSGLFHRFTATLGAFSGNIERAQLEICCRTPPGFDFHAFDRFLDGIVGDARLEVDERTPAVQFDRSEPTVRALLASIRRHGGRPTCKVKTGTSDMNIVAKRWQVPMVAYGPGDSSLDHTADEHVDLNEYATAIEVLRDALPSLLAELSERRAVPVHAEAENVYTEEEEADLAARLEALGYLE